VNIHVLRRLTRSQFCAPVGAFCKSGPRRQATSVTRTRRHSRKPESSKIFAAIFAALHRDTASREFFTLSVAIGRGESH
jgi:hypothetical protein